MDIQILLFKRFSLAFLTLIIIFGSTLTLAQNNTNEDREALLRSAFIYRITKFVTWPQDKMSSENFTFCLTSTEKFSTIFKQSVKNRKVLSKNIIVDKIQLGQPSEHCHVLYSPDNSLADYLPNTKNTGVLTIGNSTDFIQQGGIIRFIELKNHLGFEINNNAALSYNLSISAHLLRLSVTK